MLDLSPVEVFFLQRPVVIDKKSSMLKRIMFYMKVFVDPFLIVVLRPWRKTPGSPSTEDGGRNNGGNTSFFTEHGNQPLHFHQGFRGEGRIVDIVSRWSKRSPPLLTFSSPVVHLSQNLKYEQFVSPAPLKPLYRISWNFVIMMCTCAYSQEILIWFFFWENN